ncbi:branched-chain amino acid aminotransferase II [Rhodocollybia butyracea]|uniref:Branched-chain-amino-acid aminotransferase n=1 Tax=Rhodocollybia butyracea TaxID=206335 RepID=A0A9P5PWD9_9AGAR|nr:branched-chain amino acid aminotransferase II [Rhodocollybia butyracea]
MSSLIRSVRLRGYRRLYGPSSLLAGRFYQTDAMTGEVVALPDIQPSNLQFVKTGNPKAPPPSKSLMFGHTFTDHMLTIPWSSVEGWGTPKIGPYGPLSLEPSCTVLHYAQTIFEGMKAYRDEHGKVTLFRPDMNMKRMNTSASRIALPTFNGDALLELIKKLIHSERDWIPREPGHSLYIRPTMIGTQRFIGVAPPSEALLFVICSPVGPYYPKVSSPSRYMELRNISVPLPVVCRSIMSLIPALLIQRTTKGTGAYKLGVNYAPGVMPQKEAAKMGYAQNLWLHGPEHYLTEVGTMNLFVVLKKGDAIELVTPPLDGMILPGVTRDSVLALARDHASGASKISNLPEKLIVSERAITMKEIQDAEAAGTLVELFGSGTAAVISPVNRIGYLGKDVLIPTGDDGMGPISRPIWTELTGRQMGTIPSDWSVPVTA